VETLNFKREWKTHSGRVVTLGTHPKRPNEFISGGYDKTVVLWVLNGDLSALYSPCKGHGNIVSRAAFSRDGEHIISSSWDKTARVQKLNGGQPSRVGDDKFVMFKLDTSVASVILLSNDRMVIMVPMLKPYFKLFNTLGEMKLQWDCEENISCIEPADPTFPRNLSIFVALWESYEILNLLGESEIAILHRTSTKHKPVSLIISMSCSRDRTLAAASRDGTIYLYRQDLTLIEVILARSDLYQVSYSPIESVLAVATSVGVCVINTKTKQQFWYYDKNQKREFLSVCWTCDGKTVLAGSSDGFVAAFQL